jgi:phage shock protein PspC (stress-responsive transcriptional regulator)
MESMSSSSPHATEPPPQAPPGNGGAPPLYRPVHDRVVAGVSGGLGRHFGVDPVVFRVVFAVLALFGGLGVLLYGLGWLLMPADDHPTPLARDVLNHRNLKAAIRPVAVTGLGIAIFFSYIDHGFDDGVFPLLVIVAIILYAARRSTRREMVDAGLDPGGFATPGTAATPPPPVPPTAPPAGAAGEDKASGARLAPGPTPWWRRPTQADAAAPGLAPRRPRSYLTAVTLSLATVAAGLMWWITAATDADVSFQVGLAVVLAVLAGGLLVGTVFGRARWLIVPALAVTALLSAVAAITVPITGSTGEREITPASAAAVESPYRMKAGDMRIDLTKLDLGPTNSTRIVATMGAGTLKVTVPDDVRVVVEANADIGEVQLPNGKSSGLDAERRTVMEPRSGTTSRGTITLELGVGLGNVEVRYAV